MGQAAPDSDDVLQVNVGASGKARLIMRNKGNFRLLLNASIWPGMKVTPMDGGKVGPLCADSPTKCTARPLPFHTLIPCAGGGECDALGAAHLICAIRAFPPASQCQRAAWEEGCPMHGRAHTSMPIPYAS